MAAARRARLSRSSQGTRRNSAELVNATGENLDHILDRVSTAYAAKFGSDLPEGVAFRNISEDPTVRGRIHFDVVRGGVVLGTGMYKPRHRSVWVDWTRAV